MYCKRNGYPKQLYLHKGFLEQLKKTKQNGSFIRQPHLRITLLIQLQSWDFLRKRLLSLFGLFRAATEGSLLVALGFLGLGL